MRRYGLMALVCALVLVVAGCGTQGGAAQPAPASTIPEATEAQEEAQVDVEQGGEAFVPTQADIQPGSIIELEGFYRNIHDPVIAEENGRYYVFSTGARLIVICSDDMVTWEWCGRVFEDNPDWALEVNRNLDALWAPDISFFNGKWHLYFAASNFGQQNSAIGLATNVTLDPDSPDFAWVDEGIVLRSQPGDDWNAIDANLVFDDAGVPWLSWGSFWNGLYMRRIDASTGMFDASDETVHHIASRRTPPEDSTAIEAPHIVKRGDYYYLFASFDQCCSGINSTYNTRVGRSESVTGPYVDRAGVPMLESGGTQILFPYDHWVGPGHNGMLVDGEEYWMVYHAYDARMNGIPHLRIERVHWDDEGWPWMPSQVADE